MWWKKDTAKCKVCCEGRYWISCGWISLHVGAFIKMSHPTGIAGDNGRYLCYHSNSILVPGPRRQPFSTGISESITFYKQRTQFKNNGNKANLNNWHAVMSSPAVSRSLEAWCAFHWQNLQTSYNYLLTIVGRNQIFQKLICCLMQNRVHFHNDFASRHFSLTSRACFHIALFILTCIYDVSEVASKIFI